MWLQKQISASDKQTYPLSVKAEPDSTNQVAEQKGYNTRGMTGPGPHAERLPDNEKKDALCFVPSA
jgi:hypothetical protein